MRNFEPTVLSDVIEADAEARRAAAQRVSVLRS
jgi:hypothetical protein